MSGWFLLASAIVQYQRKIKLFNSIQACINFSNRDLKNTHIPKDNDDPVPKKGIVVPIRRSLVVRCRLRMSKVYRLSLHGVWCMVSTTDLLV